MRTIFIQLLCAISFAGARDAMGACQGEHAIAPRWDQEEELLAYNVR